MANVFAAEGTTNVLECARVENVFEFKEMRRNVVGGKVCEGGRNGSEANGM